MESLIISQKLTVWSTPIAINQILYTSQRQCQPNHLHSYLELYYNTEGSSVLRLNFNKEIVVDKNHWILLNRNIMHEEIVYGRCMGFSLGIETDPAGVSLFPKLLRDGYVLGYSETIGDILMQIVDEYNEHPPGYTEYTNHLLSLLMLDLCRDSGGIVTADRRDCTDPVNQYMIIDKFFNRVFLDQAQDLTISDLSKQLHMSTRNVNRVLQKHYGMNFQQMLLSMRMRFAEYQLLQTNRSISEISEQCDLSEPYLIRSFKEFFGMTPAQYRKQNKEES